jgi:hypothetical protein
VILVLVLAVPIAYRHLWPITVKRPKLFLLITVTLGLVISAAAIFWLFNLPVGIGITGASRATDASQAAFEAVLRNRLLVACVFAVLVEYLVCRNTADHHGCLEGLYPPVVVHGLLAAFEAVVEAQRHYRPAIPFYLCTDYVRLELAR